jgi:hypothetical protein
MKLGLSGVLGLIFSARATGASVVPRAIGEANVGHITAALVVGLDEVDESGVSDGAIGVQQALFDAIDDDTRSGRGDPDMGVGDAILGEGKVNVAGLISITALLGHCDLAEEGIAGVGETDQEKGSGCSNGRVDTVLNGGEDGDEHGGKPDDELEGRDTPEGVDLE